MLNDSDTYVELESNPDTKTVQLGFNPRRNRVKANCESGYIMPRAHPEFVKYAPRSPSSHRARLSQRQCMPLEMKMECSFS